MESSCLLLGCALGITQYEILRAHLWQIHFANKWHTSGFQVQSPRPLQISLQRSTKLLNSYMDAAACPNTRSKHIETSFAHPCIIHTLCTNICPLWRALSSIQSHTTVPITLSADSTRGPWLAKLLNMKDKYRPHPLNAQNVICTTPDQFGWNEGSHILVATGTFGQHRANEMHRLSGLQ